MSLRSKIESLLFVANKPLTAKELGGILEVEATIIETELDNLMEDYVKNESGLQVIKNNYKYQLVSAAANSDVVASFIKDETSGELSRPSLEALTIIAYRGPITKVDLDRIRGVNCSLIIRNLLLRGLIEEKFEKEKNETYYLVTMDFVRHLGVNSIDDLPDYARLNQEEAIERILDAAEAAEEAVASN
jgi:segregation and condensation protein B